MHNVRIESALKILDTVHLATCALLAIHVSFPHASEYVQSSRSRHVAHYQLFFGALQSAMQLNRFRHDRMSRQSLTNSVMAVAQT
jgi:hypothetical protein